MRRLTAVVEAVSQAIAQRLDMPFVVFGHSMGALLSFETARRPRRIYERQPAHIFISARGALQLACRDPLFHAVSQAEFIAEVRCQSGTPLQVLENSEVICLLHLTLRTDYEVYETYIYKSEARFACSMSVFGGLSDNIGQERLEAWSEQTSACF